MPPPASASAVRAYCRRSFHSEPAMQATPTTVPSTTPVAVRAMATTARTSATRQISPSMPPVSSSPRLDQDLRVRVGARERLEGARHAVHPHPSRDQRRDGDAPLGDGGERARELL